MNNTLESAKEELVKQLSIVQTAVLSVGLLYVTGYYINSMFLQNYGIAGTELLRLEYIRIGFTFWLIVCAMVLLPLGAFHLTYSVRSASALPHLRIGLVGTSLNVIVMLGVPIALSLLATDFEWKYVFPNRVLGFTSFNHSVSFALAVSAFLVVLLPILERMVANHLRPKAAIWVFRVAIEPIRYGGLFLTVFLISASVVEVPWLPAVLNKSVPFFSVVVVLGSGLLAAYYWVSFIQRTKGTLMAIPLVTLGLAFFYYLAMASYVYGLYPAIPSNRGGKLPLTRAYLQIEGYDSVFQSSECRGDLNLKGPAYVIEETDSVLYIACQDMDRWFEHFVPISSIRKEEVGYMLLERIDDGFPKTVE